MLNPFRRGADPQPLLVGMTGVKLGERLAQLGCASGGRLGAIAAKVGLSGRAVAIVPDQAGAARAQAGAADAGVLIEVETAPLTRVPLDDGSFDLVILDDTGGLFGAMAQGEREAAIAEALRILRAGGRALVIGSVARSGIMGLVTRAPATPRWDIEAALETRGFKSVRSLAERDGFEFVEGIKPRSAASQA